MRSILFQTIQDIELIVVDNFSSYDVQSLLDEFRDDRIRFFKNSNGGVIGVNRNVGIQQAKGRFLAFCDDDDLWFPQKIERQLHHFDPLRHVGVGTSSLMMGEIRSSRYQAPLSKGDRGLNEILKQGGPPLSSLMVLRDETFFSEEPRFKNAEDFEYQIRLVKKTKKTIGIIDTPLIRYRIHSLNANRERAQRLNALHVLWNNRAQLPRPLFRVALGRLYFLAGVSSLREREKIAQKYFYRALVLRAPEWRKAAFGYGLANLPIFVWAGVLRLYFLLINGVSLSKSFWRKND